MSTKPTILAVDDTSLQLVLIERNLKSLSEPHELETASSGATAWQMLQAAPNHYDLVLLDRNMPDMDGLEVLKLIRGHETLKNIPVILQTAETKEENILEGMQAGAYYYLTKPFTKGLMLSVVETALRERLQQKALQLELHARDRSIKFIKHAVLEFKTIDEANLIALLLANTHSCPEKIVSGLAELLVNAVEHGNLNISYSEKSILYKDGLWHAEIEKRSKLPEYKDKVVTVEVSSNQHGIEFVITDQGEGFDWESYLDFSPERIMDTHGRGIAMANKHCFARLEYRDKGNIVSAFLEYVPIA